MADCLFCKIIAGEIPASKIYEDDEVLGFNDINGLCHLGHFKAGYQYKIFILVWTL